MSESASGWTRTGLLGLRQKQTPCGSRGRSDTGAPRGGWLGHATHATSGLTGHEVNDPTEEVEGTEPIAAIATLGVRNPDGTAPTGRGGGMKRCKAQRSWRSGLVEFLLHLGPNDRRALATPRHALLSLSSWRPTASHLASPAPGPGWLALASAGWLGR